MPSTISKRQRVCESDRDEAQSRIEISDRQEDIAQQLGEHSVSRDPQSSPMGDQVRRRTKYRASKVTKAVAICLQSRAPEQRSAVFEWGKLLSGAEVKRLCQRSRPNIMDLLNPPALPQGWVIRTPKEDLTEALTQDLPFYQWERRIQAGFLGSGPRVGQAELFASPNSMVAQDGSLPTSTGGGWWSFSDETTQYIQSSTVPHFASQRLALCALDSIVPSQQLVYPHQRKPTSTGTGLTISCLQRQVLSSLANNFAGLSDFPIWQPLMELQKLSPESLYNIVMKQDDLTSRAIAHSLIRGAVEIGEHTIIDVILGASALAIDIDEVVCTVDGQQFTVVERAVSLGHGRIVQLLAQKADIHKTFRCIRHGAASENWCLGCRSGAFSHALHSRRSPRLPQLDSASFALLVSSVRSIEISELGELVNLKEVEHVKSVIRHHGKKLQSQPEVRWSLHSIATLPSLIISTFAEDDAVDVIDAMHQLDFQINRDTLNQAARQGYVRLYHILRSRYDFVPDNDTFYASIMGGNTFLILELLQNHGASITYYPDTNNATPLSAAISTGDNDVIELLRRHGAFELLDIWKYFLSAWKAAVNTGNLLLVRQLLDRRKNIPATDLGQALSVACFTGDEELSQILLERGADLETETSEVWYRHSSTRRSPLLNALESRQPTIVDTLLKAGANPSPASHPSEAIRSAVKWGNYPTIHRLLRAGAVPCGECLALAIERGDTQLVSELIDAGADINDGALSVAAKHANLSMAEHLLARGAEPDDSEALLLASIHSQPIFNFILKSPRSRYGKRRRGFGVAVLHNAVLSEDLTRVEYLLKYGADASAFVKLRDKYITPFGAALTVDGGKNRDLIELFINSGCHPSDIASGVDERVRKPDKHYSFTVTTGSFSTRSGGEGPEFPKYQGPALNLCPAARDTALLVAIRTKNIALVTYLARKGADIKAPAYGRIKRTPMQMAAEIGCGRMVDLLYSLGADVNEEPNRIGGATALQLASLGGYVAIVTYLLSRGAKVDAPSATISGQMALEAAAAHGRIDTVCTLLNAGAADYGRDTAQITRATHLAGTNGHHPVVSVLRETQIPDLSLDDCGIDNACVAIDQEWTGEVDRIAREMTDTNGSDSLREVWWED